ncbi:hypothetical protein EXIGLDRAFT_775130 [Exidia glandulosa HHB12029]|uniref:Uncharacterized protein n=1 Tax=Exidia glandulosa HHB12029 TaxID=1314781 RepID=A0A165E1F8_EXIGL|nr:hypothetical protein EXIGLDRAFT_775130 [Exidia glandulosa HHB12029]
MASRILAAGPAAETTRNVVTGDIGFGYGPYAYAGNIQPPATRPRGPQKLTRARAANATNATTVASPPLPPAEQPSQLLAPPRRQNTLRMPSTNAVPAAVIHDKEGRQSTEETAVEREPEWDAIPDDVFTIFSGRGWINMITLVSLLLGILILFAGYPIITRFVNPPPNLGGFDVTYQDGLAPPTPAATNTDDSR